MNTFQIKEDCYLDKDFDDTSRAGIAQSVEHLPDLTL